MPAGARADVEHAPADEAECLLLRLDPVVVLGEEPFRPERRPRVPVVALELRLAGLSFQVVEQEPPESVLGRVEGPGYAASEVRKPRSAAIGRMAATTLRMWSSSSRPSASAPR